MKRIIPLLLAVALIFTGCGSAISNFKNLYGDAYTLFEKTILEMFQAIQNEDKEALKKLFSPNVRDNESFDNMVDALFDFIQGDVISYHIDNSPGASKAVLPQVTTRSAYGPISIKTSSNTYYLEVKECLIDTSDKNNEGICSVYIIDAKNWQTRFTYRGDGLWTDGIHIETGNEPHHKDVLE